MTSQEITEIITQTINSLFNNLIGSIDNSLYSILDDVTFISQDIIHDSYFEKILGTNINNGILLICNSLLIGFILYYCVHLLFSSYINSKIENPFKFIFKIILIAILINSSFFICEKILYLNSTLSSAIRELGENIYNKNISFSQLINELNSDMLGNFVKSPELNDFFPDFDKLDKLDELELEFVFLLTFGVLPIQSILYFLNIEKINWIHFASGSISKLFSSIALFADASMTTLQLYSLQISDRILILFSISSLL